MRGAGRILDSYANPREASLFFLYQAMQTLEKVFYCFYKITFLRNAKIFVMALIKEKFLPVAKS